jgi:hypothetical protein
MSCSPAYNLNYLLTIIPEATLDEIFAISQQVTEDNNNYDPRELSRILMLISRRLVELSKQLRQSRLASAGLKILFIIIIQF